MSTESSDGWFGGVVVVIDRDQPNNPYIDAVQYSCPDTVDDADIPSPFEGLETALIDLNGTHVPRLEVHCRMRKTAKSISKFLLDGSIFSRYFGELKKVSLCLQDDFGWVSILPDKILSAPTQFTLDDITIPLDTAQRAEWLTSMDEHGFDRRDFYLRGLLEASRAASAALDANSQLATSTLPEAEVGVSARTEACKQGWRGNRGGRAGHGGSGAGRGGAAGRRGRRA